MCYLIYTSLPLPLHNSRHVIQTISSCALPRSCHAAPEIPNSTSVGLCLCCTAAHRTWHVAGLTQMASRLCHSSVPLIRDGISRRFQLNETVMLTACATQHMGWGGGAFEPAVQPSWQQPCMHARPAVSGPAAVACLCGPGRAFPRPACRSSFLLCRDLLHRALPSASPALPKSRHRLCQRSTDHCQDRHSVLAASRRH